MRTCLYYRVEPMKDRWFPSDRIPRRIVRKLLRGKPRLGGVDKVFANLCLGLDQLKVPYVVNLPFSELTKDDRVGVLGRGRYALEGYDRSSPIVAGVGLMTHPSEWPDLCDRYPIARYLQHSEWANDVYKPYFGDRCGIWPVGIDTRKWKPLDGKKDIDFLLYNKVRWDYANYEANLVQPIRELLNRRGLKFREIRYGSYAERDYQQLLARSRSMIFLCEHESQGLAYQECLSSDVPVLAWDQGKMLDPQRFVWGAPDVSASSVPYFDIRCGEKFGSIRQFGAQLDLFLERVRHGDLRPRKYILENLTLDRCAARFLKILEETAP
jgi:hypothetical protein